MSADAQAARVREAMAQAIAAAEVDWSIEERARNLIRLQEAAMKRDGMKELQAVVLTALKEPNFCDEKQNQKVQ